MVESSEERAWAFERGQRSVLEHVAAGVPLPRVLDDITRLIERQQPGMLCSILLLDAEHGRLRHGAAPSLPTAYVRAIDGSAIGPRAGSCGTAAYFGERVIVEDIATHPAWEDYRHFALPVGLRACWSTPIFSSARDVLGTFAMYFHDPRGPSATELEWIERATHLAAVAIERERNVTALRTIEQQRQIIFDGINDVLFSVAVEPGGVFRFLAINAAFTRATGLDAAQVVGRLVEDVIPEPSRALVLANYRTCVCERRTVSWDETTVYPTGTKHGEVSISPVFAADGACATLLGTVHDITERKRAEERLRAQAALLDAAHDAILVRDLDGTIRFWNEGAARLYGWRADEVLGRKPSELLFRGAAAFDDAQREVLEKGAWHGELEQVSRSGAALVVDGSWTLLCDEQGRARSILAINTDITEKRHLERRLARARRMESLGRLAGSIAHDFNNILAAILANVDLGKQELSPPGGAHQAFQEIERAGTRATSLVRQILTFSRDEPPKKVPVDLEAVTEEALRLLRTTRPRAVDIAVEVAPDVPTILADSTQVHQIVMNLCTNALHATAERGGRVSVRLERAVLQEELVVGGAVVEPGPYARLTVSDDGTGIDEATLERIFDPFFTTKGPGKGTGLGLSVVHGIVKSHGGEIVVHSAVGRGTSFEVYLPVTGA